MSGTTEFLKARDFLLAHRADYQHAYRDFRWPHLDDFNWALDYFDRMAQENSRPALSVLDESGVKTTLSFCGTLAPVQPGGTLSPPSWRRPRRSHPADARQRGASSGRRCWRRLSWVP